MQCPKCKSRSLIVKDGQVRCESKNCTYIQFHVISYKNQNITFEGEKGAENRFNSMYYNAQNRDRDVQKYEKNYQTGQAVIRKLCTAMQLSNNIQDIAKSRLIQVLKIKYPEEKPSSNSNNTSNGNGNGNGNEQQTSQRQKKQPKFPVTDKQIAAYCLWLACCQRDMYFKDVRIANQMGISKQQWSNIHKKMESKFKTIIKIPLITPEFEIKRMCRKRKINDIQRDAMIQMATKVSNAAVKGGSKNATVAAFIFWQIMIRSTTYNGDGQFDMKQYLNQSSKNNDDENQHHYWTQKQFDISFQSVKKFKNSDTIRQNLESYIPHFKTRKYDEKSRQHLQAREHHRDRN